MLFISRSYKNRCFIKLYETVCLFYFNETLYTLQNKNVPFAHFPTFTLLSVSLLSILYKNFPFL